MNPRTIVFIGITLFCLSGCTAPTKQAIQMDPAFQERVGTTLYVLPVIDARKDTSAKFNMESDIRKPVARRLRKKGYEVELLSNLGVGEGTPSAAVAEMSQEELCALGPQEAPSVLVLYLDDASSKYVVMGYTFKVEMTGLLLDKQRKMVLWKDRGIGTQGQGGLISGLMAPSVRSGALSSAVGGMLMSFPKKAKPVQ